MGRVLGLCWYLIGGKGECGGFKRESYSREVFPIKKFRKQRKFS